MRLLEKKAKSFEALIQTFSHQKFHWVNPFSRRLISVGLAFDPALSLLSYTCILTCIVASIFAVVDFNAEDIAISIPSRSTIKSLLHEIAAKVLVVI